MGAVKKPVKFPVVNGCKVGSGVNVYYRICGGIARLSVAPREALTTAAKYDAIMITAWRGPYAKDDPTVYVWEMKGGF